jgi:hypothetical protein
MPRKRKRASPKPQAAPPLREQFDAFRKEARAFAERNPPLRELLKWDELRGPGQSKLLDEIKRTQPDMLRQQVKFRELIEGRRQEPEPEKPQRTRSRRHTNHRGWQRERIITAIRNIYDGRIPPETELPDAELCASVKEHLENAKRSKVPGSSLPIPAPKTIRRARKRQLAAEAKSAKFNVSQDDQ